jgi:hypothetical protein
MPPLTVTSNEVKFEYNAAHNATPNEKLDTLANSGFIVIDKDHQTPQFLLRI